MLLLCYKNGCGGKAIMLDTLITVEEDQKEIEQLILDYISKLKKPVEISKVYDTIIDSNLIADYEFRYALAHLLASRKLKLDSTRRILKNT